jgi:mono/diheme cytochrome c family protein
MNMAKVLRWAGYLLGGLAVIAVGAVLFIWAAADVKLSEGDPPHPERLATPTPAQLADGPRQLRVLGCLSCHGDMLRGDLFMDEPGFAKIYASNLTHVAAKASDQLIAQAIRQGIGHDGRPLLIMPSEGYQFMTDSEVSALISAIRTFPKGGRETPSASFGFKGRVGLALGKFHTAPELVGTYRKSPIADFGPQFAAGRHIVAVNCTECHGPNLNGQEVKPGSIAPDLAIAGAYDLDQFKTLLRSGIPPGGKRLGMMASVARDDFSHLKDEEIAAIHAYLVERNRRAP